jgi:hypothetical protein
MMKQFVKISLLLATLSYCEHPEARYKDDPANYYVEFLFEFGGCKVYGFHYAGHTRTFENCKGESK